MDRTTSTLPEQRLRALVLDDDAAALHDLRRSLEARFFSVVSAGDGASGLDLLLRELLDLDVLVMDMDLPHRDARSFADLIRRAGGERDLAIVVLATEAVPARHAELLALGVDAVVDRNLGPEAVAAAVHEAVVARRRSGVRSSEPPPSPVGSAPSVSDARWALSFRRWSFLPV